MKFVAELTPFNRLWNIRGRIMRLSTGRQRVSAWAVIPLSIAALMIVTIIHRSPFVHAGQTGAPETHVIKLGTARPGFLYAITLGVKDPAQIQGNDSVRVTVSDAQPTFHRRIDDRHNHSPQSVCPCRSNGLR